MGGRYSLPAPFFRWTTFTKVTVNGRPKCTLIWYHESSTQRLKVISNTASSRQVTIFDFANLLDIDEGGKSSRLLRCAFKPPHDNGSYTTIDIVSLRFRCRADYKLFVKKLLEHGVLMVKYVRIRWLGLFRVKRRTLTLPHYRRYLLRLYCFVLFDWRPHWLQYYRSLAISGR